MYSFLSTFLPPFVMPATVVLMLFVTALVLFFRGKRKASGKVLIAAVLVLWVSSMPLVANTLMGGLERVHPPLALDDVPEAGCIVLLGGIVRSVEGSKVEFNNSEGRFHAALQLFLAGRAKTLIITSSADPLGANGETEAEAIKTLMVAKGAPEADILIEEMSQNTRQNALHSKTILDLIACEKPLLVTSASHMPRAAAAFARVGVSVFPVPTGQRVTADTGPAASEILPSLAALNMTTDALYEWIGRLVYRFRGWN